MNLSDHVSTSLNNLRFTSDITTRKGMTKCELPKASKREDGVDFISKLPDAILLLILSRLISTEEVIRSSILSRRWRYVWTAIPSLNLGTGHVKRSKTREFKEFVDWVLVNRTADLVRFRLICSNHYNMSTVRRWIHGAVTRNVKHLVLEIGRYKNNEDIEMPHCLVTCGSLEILSLFLLGRRLRPPNNISWFPALRVLELNCVDFLEDGHLVKVILEKCPLLEDLTLEECFSQTLNILCISSPKLKKLTISNLDDDISDGAPCNGIKICCPKLVELNTRSHYTTYNLFFECLDSLQKAVIKFKLEGNTKSVLFPGISGVEYLSIDPFFFSQCIDAALDPALPNLKVLVLRTSMDDFSMDIFNQILKYYPKLESLKLMIEKDFNDSEASELVADDIMEILTPDLKRAEFFEYNGETPKLVADMSYFFFDLSFIWGNKARF